METLTLLIKLGLSFYVLTISYLLLIYYIRGKFNVPVQDTTLKKSNRKFHISLVFNGLSTGEEIINQVQNLNKQTYQNFTAVFITQPTPGLYNGHPSVNIIQTGELNKGYNYLDLAKPSIPENTHAILVLDKNSVFEPNLLKTLNEKLNEGHLAVQLRVEPQIISDWGFDYNKTSRKILNVLDRDSRVMRGLSASLWRTGFALSKDLFYGIPFKSIGFNDKAIQTSLLANSVKIAYEPMALIFEPLLEQQENWIESKNKSWQFYLHNLVLGFKLLIEGIKNPSADKIAFGINYLRPPLWLMLTSSLLILFLNSVVKSSTEPYWLICIPGVLLSSFLLIKPAFEKQVQ